MTSAEYKETQGVKDILQGTNYSSPFPFTILDDHQISPCVVCLLLLTEQQRKRKEKEILEKVAKKSKKNSSSAEDKSASSTADAEANTAAGGGDVDSLVSKLKRKFGATK